MGAVVLDARIQNCSGPQRKSPPTGICSASAVTRWAAMYFAYCADLDEAGMRHHIRAALEEFGPRMHQGKVHFLTRAEGKSLIPAPSQQPGVIAGFPQTSARQPIVSANPLLGARIHCSTEESGAIPILYLRKRQFAGIGRKRPGWTVNPSANEVPQGWGVPMDGVS